MRIKPQALSYLSAAIWLIVGLFLANTGLRLIIAATKSDGFYPLLHSLHSTAGEEGAALLLIAAALVIGTLKARTALAKAADKNLSRHRSFEKPMPIWMLFDKATYILIACMMGLGILLRLSGVPTDIRAFILMIVGFALIQGAVRTARLISIKN